MVDTPGRLLRLLSLLQTRPRWSGPELAERLAVTTRTVRRDVDRLRNLGYPVAAAPGTEGGYQLGAGGRLPPLLLDDDEAVAVAIGLRLAADGSVSGLDDATLSALAKLDQVLPAHLGARVRAVHGVTRELGRRPADQVEASTLVALAQACRGGERVRFAYTDRAGAVSDRLADAHRLVRAGPRWYFVAHDCLRADWRTFRVDRISEAVAIGVRAELVDPPDAVELVARGLAVGGYEVVARIRLPLGLEAARDLLPPSVATLVADEGESTVFELGGPEAGMAGWLAGLPCPVEVLAPAELRERLRAHVLAVAEANR